MRNNSCIGRSGNPKIPLHCKLWWNCICTRLIKCTAQTVWKKKNSVCSVSYMGLQLRRNNSSFSLLLPSIKQGRAGGDKCENVTVAHLYDIPVFRLNLPQVSRSGNFNRWSPSPNQAAVHVRDHLVRCAPCYHQFCKGGTRQKPDHLWKSSLADNKDHSSKLGMPASAQTHPARSPWCRPPNFVESMTLPMGQLTILPFRGYTCYFMNIGPLGSETKQSKVRVTCEHPTSGPVSESLNPFFSCTTTKTLKLSR